MSFPNGGVASGKPCEYCKVALALVFCRVEEVFMCLGCDAKVHASNRLGSKHARVWVCEVCEQVPAAVMCKADAAALCVTCDRDIHSTNPLAERHERTPLAPFYNTAESGVNSAAAFEHGNVAMDPCISSTVIVDGFLDFDCPVSWESNSQISAPVTNQEKHLEIYFTRSNTTWSSLDVGLVPEGSSVSEISNWNGGGSVASGEWNGMCREARVMRYREKRKNRKFQKTIRYASRKAYAEIRPRIKGRFAKRIDVESEFDMDTLFSSADSTAGICR